MHLAAMYSVTLEGRGQRGGVAWSPSKTILLETSNSLFDHNDKNKK